MKLFVPIQGIKKRGRTRPIQGIKKRQEKAVYGSSDGRTRLVELPRCIKCLFLKNFKSEGRVDDLSCKFFTFAKELKT